MALPVGLPTSALSFGPYTDLSGSPAAYGYASGTITPVHPETKQPVDLVHVETGQVVVPAPIEIVLGEDTTLVTDPIPRSGTGQLSPDNFLLHVAFDSPRSPKNRLIRLLPDAEAVVDYDLLTASPTEPAVYLPIAVSAALLDDATAAAQAAASSAAVAAAEAAAASDAAEAAAAGVTGSAASATAAQTSASAAAASAAAAQAGVATKADITYVDSGDAALDTRLDTAEATLSAATAAATASALAKRDGFGNIAFNNVVVNETTQPYHATRRDYVDAIGVTDGTPNRVVRTDVNGDIYSRATYGSKTPPTLASELTRKDYVDSADATLEARLRRPTRRFVTSSQTIALTDEGTSIAFDTTSAVTVTIPANSSVAFPIDGWVDVERSNVGTNPVTVAPAAGVTIRNSVPLSLVNANTRVRLIKIATDTWLMLDISVATGTSSVVNDSIVRRSSTGESAFGAAYANNTPAVANALTRRDFVEALVNPIPKKFSWRSGYYYGPAGGITSTTVSLSRTQLAPMWIPAAVTINMISFTVNTAQAGATFQPMIYGDSSGWPGGAPLYTGPAVDCSTTGTKDTTVSVSLPQGWVWIGGLTLGATSPTFSCHSTIYSSPHMGTSPSGTATGNNPQFANQSANATAPPNPWDSAYGVISGNPIPRVVVRAA